MLKRFLAWLIGLFVHEAVEQVKEEIKKPDTIEDAKTPKEIREGFQDFVRDRMAEHDVDHPADDVDRVRDANRGGE